MNEAATGAGASGTPSTAQAVTTGDAELDRVASINIDSIRDQRLGASGTAGGPAPGPGGTAASSQSGDAPPQPKAKPIYKEWWFWAVVAVGAVVLYEVATSPSEPTRQATGREAPQSSSASSGFAVLRF